jgi:hypothetical protein
VTAACQPGQPRSVEIRPGHHAQERDTAEQVESWRGSGRWGTAADCAASSDADSVRTKSLTDTRRGTREEIFIGVPSHTDRPWSST